MFVSLPPGGTLRRLLGEGAMQSWRVSACLTVITTLLAPMSVALRASSWRSRSRCATSTRATSQLRMAQAGPVTRRELVWSVISASALALGASTATAKSPPPEGLGVVDDLLADCPPTPTCVSTQDDRPYPFMEPWTYETSTERAMKKLSNYLAALPGAKVISSAGRYLRVEFTQTDLLTPSVDDVEFYFTPNDTLVQFRAARREGPADFGSNRRRMDAIRLALRFETVPVLRNRRRTLIFGESPLDTFGPPLRDMDPSAVYGDLDPKAPVFETPSAPLLERARPWWGASLRARSGVTA